MPELEAAPQQFGEFLMKARLVKESAAPYCVTERLFHFTALSFTTRLVRVSAT
jgi:hypothetical protein